MFPLPSRLGGYWAREGVWGVGWGGEWASVAHWLNKSAVQSKWHVP